MPIPANFRKYSFEHIISNINVRRPTVSDPIADTLIHGRRSVRIIRYCDFEKSLISKKPDLEKYLSFQIYAGNNTLVLSFSLCHLFEHGNLTKEVLLWLGGASEHRRTRGRIRND